MSIVGVDTISDVTIESTQHMQCEQKKNRLFLCKRVFDTEDVVTVSAFNIALRLTIRVDYRRLIDLCWAMAVDSLVIQRS